MNTVFLGFYGSDVEVTLSLLVVLLLLLLLFSSSLLLGNLHLIVTLPSLKIQLYNLYNNKYVIDPTQRTNTEFIFCIHSCSRF